MSNINEHKIVACREEAPLYVYIAWNLDTVNKTMI